MRIPMPDKGRQLPSLSLQQGNWQLQADKHKRARQYKRTYHNKHKGLLQLW